MALWRETIQYWKQITGGVIFKRGKQSSRPARQKRARPVGAAGKREALTVNDQHFARLERMYLAAPCNQPYQPDIHIQRGRAEVSIQVKPDFFHAGGSLHGSVYFKLLDDAAFFAAQSLLTDHFLLTADFTIYFLKPVTSGRLTACGEVISAGQQLFVAQATLTDERGRKVGFGSGTYARTRIRLSEKMGYR
ncbi:MAG: PaaI family thioesterase [Calditrichaeota bacterium]|nr:MAG: PaaI family thioesterase [Calditrichota bacterium]